MTNVLVFGGGTEIGLEIHRSLAPLRDVEVLGAGAAGSSHGPYVFERWHILPSAGDASWLQALNDLIANEDVDFVFPAHDDALLELALHRDKVAATVLTSPTATCQIARSKRLTYSRLSGTVPTPRSYDREPRPGEFPVFVKPDRGQGSQNAEVIDDVGQLECWMRRAGASWEDGLKGWVCTEFLPGPEYTVDCFTDRDRGLLFVGPRERIRTRNGICVSAVAVEDPTLRELAYCIDGELAFHGAWFFQVKRTATGEAKLLEVAPRIAGMMGFHRALGVNLPQLTIYEAQRTVVRILPLTAAIEADRALVTRYTHDLQYVRAYIDLDDTLLSPRGVDTRVVRFIFQCVNRGVEVVLLTRHDGDLALTLRRHRLTGLFDRMIHVRRGAHKADHVEPGSSIFVDDSFSERAAVADRHGIPTFDGSMIEVLLDDRA